MRRASLPRRLDRLTGHRETVDLERTVRKLAAVTGLAEAEVRAELAHIHEHTRRFGPSTLAQTVRRCAAELGLVEAQVSVEYAQMAGTAGARS